MWWQALLGAVAASLVVFAMVRRDKTGPDQAMEHPIRRRLARLVKRRPGVRLSEMWRALGVARGTVEYHILILQRLGHVQTARDPGATRCFPPDIDAETLERISSLLRGRSLEIAAAVLQWPGMSQQSLRDALAMSPKVCRENLRVLIGAGLLVEQTRHRRKEYHPTNDLQDLLPVIASHMNGVGYHDADDEEKGESPK